MVKKISVWLLCAACLLSAAMWAFADDEPVDSDAPSVSDVDVPPVNVSDPPVDSEPDTELYLIITPVFSDTDLLVTVTDPYGDPVPNIPLAFDVGSTLNLMTAFTNADGAAALSIVGIDPGTEIVCHSAETYTGTLTYLSAEIVVTVPGDVSGLPDDTDASDTDTEPPTSPTAATTLAPLPTLPPSDAAAPDQSKPTYPDVIGATTTRAQGNSIYTNLVVDEHLLELFGFSIQEFDSTGRLKLDKGTYTSLTDTYGSHLLGRLTTSMLSDVTTDQIRTAKQGVSDFADCSAENAVALTFAVSLQFLSDGDDGLPVTDASSLGSDLMFEFSIPVPKSMQNCKSFGIAMTGENIVNTLTPVIAQGGVLTFRTPALGHFTLVGFTDGTAPVSPLTIIMWVLIGAGVLMLLLMAYLIYRFFIRPRSQDPDDEPDDGRKTRRRRRQPEEEDEDEDEDEPPIPIRLKKEKKR